MQAWKLIALYVAWLFASAMIAIVTSIVVTEVLRLIGIVDSGSPSYSVTINLIFAVLWVVLAAVPFMYRNRFVDPE